MGTDSSWRAARRLGLPVVAFVNGMDKDRADLDAALQSIAGLEDAQPVLVTLPIGEHAKFEGVIDVLRGKAVRPSGEEAAPAALAEAIRAARDHVAEAVAESDDALIEKYLEEGDALRRGDREGRHRSACAPGRSCPCCAAPRRASAASLRCSAP